MGGPRVLSPKAEYLLYVFLFYYYFSSFPFPFFIIMRTLLFGFLPIICILVGLLFSPLGEEKHSQCYEYYDMGRLEENDLYFNSTATGLKVHYREFFPKSTAKGVVFISHGMREHSYFYEEISKYFSSDDYYVFFIFSDGDSLHVEDVNHYVEDQIEFIKFILFQKYKNLNLNDLPMFLVGHSMGGTIALLIGDKYLVQGEGLSDMNPDDMKIKESLNGIILIGPA